MTRRRIQDRHAETDAAENMIRKARERAEWLRREIGDEAANGILRAIDEIMGRPVAKIAVIRKGRR